MHKIKTVFLFTICLFSSFICFAKGNKDSKTAPEWISRPSEVFPNSEYLTSVGYGENRNTAEVNAVKGLASIFKQKVVAKETSSSQMSQTKSEEKIVTAKVQNFNQEVLKEVDESDLIGIEIKEYWFDGKETWYAIAILNKEKTASLYSDAINTNQTLIDSIIKSVDGKNTFSNFGKYNYAEHIAQFNEGYLDRLTVVNPEKGLALRKRCTSSKELEMKKIELAKKIPICIAFENDTNGRFAAAFAKIITEKGFKGSFDVSSRYLLSGKVTYSKKETKDGETVHCRYTLDAYLADTNSGKTLMPFNFSGREAHYNFEDAKARAVSSIEGKIKTDFETAFADFLNQYVEK